MNAILCLASVALCFSAVSALSCHSGYSYDGAVPSATATGCFSCWKSVRTTSTGGVNYQQTQWGGYACSSTPSSTFSSYLSSVADSTCSAHVVYSPQPTRATSAPYTGTYQTYEQTTPGCSTSFSVDRCESDGMETMAAFCVCCGEKCNGGLKCGAESIIASFITLAMLTVVGMLLRQ